MERCCGRDSPQTSNVLDIQGCDALTDVKVLQECEILQTLDLSGCKSIPDLGIITQISSLKLLHLSKGDIPDFGVNSPKQVYGVNVRFDQFLEEGFS